MPGYQGGVPMQPGMHPGMGMPMGMHPGMSMHPGATEFVPGNGYMQGTPGSSPYMQPGQQAIPRQKAHAPPTDEEQVRMHTAAPPPPAHSLTDPVLGPRRSGSRRRWTRARRS